MLVQPAQSPEVETPPQGCERAGSRAVVRVVQGVCAAAERDAARAPHVSRILPKAPQPIHRGQECELLAASCEPRTHPAPGRPRTVDEQGLLLLLVRTLFLQSSSFDLTVPSEGDTGVVQLVLKETQRRGKRGETKRNGPSPLPSTLDLLFTCPLPLRSRSTRSVEHFRSPEAALAFPSRSLA